MFKDRPYYDKFAAKVKRISDSYKKKCIKNNYFEISNFKVLYRPFLKPMFSILNGDANLNDFKNILIIDDTKTKGSTFSMIEKALRAAGYTGKITTFAFINNSGNLGK